MKIVERFFSAEGDDVNGEPIWPFSKIVLQKEFIIGMECEIEGIECPAPAVSGFQLTTDGSLRNAQGPGGHGHEYISHPFTKEKAYERFAKLHEQLTFFEYGFGPRTSTHIHVNCLMLDESEVKNMVLLYALFEEFFFYLVSSERRNNIHCTPLTETYLPGRYGHTLYDLTNSWSKYTALNLLPLAHHGTVEFRHLQGTSDPEVLRVWVDTLHNLWKLCQTVEITEQSLGSQEEYMNWFDEIFKDTPDWLRKQRVAVPAIIANSLLDVKLSKV